MSSKILLPIIILLSISGSIYGQVPLQFNYQAVARDAKGIPLADKDIKVRFSLRNFSELGEVEYMEIRKVHTNPFGMFNVSIGSEDAYFTTGSLEDVNWELGKKYLQVEIDFQGNSDYINMGTAPLSSVPFALFALRTLDGGTGPNQLGANGIEIKNNKIQIGNSINDSSALLIEDRLIPLNKKNLIFKDGVSEMKISKNLLTFQLDSAILEGSNNTSGGNFMVLNPIFPREDAVPFVFSRMATQQHNGTTSPNEVVMWGHNLAGGGGALINGLPAIGYSIESNFKPSPESRWVESHEFYVTPKGQQIRLKSYTINTITDHIDFYHSTDNFYIKKPLTGEEYFRVESSEDNNVQLLSLGTFRIDANTINKQVQFQALQENSELYFTSNWNYIFFPGMLIQKDGLFRMTGNMIPENDGGSVLGSSGNRFSNISSLKYQGGKLILKGDWTSYDNIQPTSTLDVEGTNGFNQLRLRKSYTPGSSADPNGNVGDLSWDENFIYIKTESGWKRTSLSSF